MRRLLIATVAVALLAPAAPAGAASCVSGMRFSRTAAKTAGVLTWRAPALAFRVYRNGVVVGQTRARRMRIRVSPGRRYAFVVRAVGAACTGRLVRAVAWRAPSSPRGLGVENVTDRSVTLRWLAVHRGDAPLAGYRVFRGRAVFRQVHRHWLTIRLASAQRYTFSVAGVDTRGHVGRRSRAITVRSAHRPPGPPTGVVVSEVSDTAATLAWNAAPAGSRPVVGYRIYRDGALVEQVAGQRARLTSLVSATRYRLAVAAVDSLGYVGAVSDPVEVDTGHVAPGAPSGLTARGVTDSAVTLAWSPAAGGSAPVVGYRIYRDGTLVGQVPGVSEQISNLAAATDYSFAVTAVDSQGYEGERSPAAAVRTAMPPPTRGRIHAFLLATTDQSFRDLQAHYQQIGTLYPTYLQCLGGGRVGGADDPLVTRWAKLRRIRVLPRFDCQSSSRLHEMLTDPAVREATKLALGNLVSRNGWDGINLDFEAGLPGDRAALTAFVSDLAGRFHFYGRSVTVEVSAKYQETSTGRSAFYDYAGLAASADTVFVMNWGLHWSTSAPGATDELWWARRVADYVASMPNRSHFVLGTNMYGIDWENGGGSAHPGTPLEHGDVMDLLARTHSGPVFDANVFAPHFSYTDGQSDRHDVWYTDARSIATRVKLARDRGLGVGLWRLGREDQALWNDPVMGP